MLTKKTPNSLAVLPSPCHSTKIQIIMHKKEEGVCKGKELRGRERRGREGGVAGERGEKMNTGGGMGAET